MHEILDQLGCPAPTRQRRAALVTASTSCVPRTGCGPTSAPPWRSPPPASAPAAFRIGGDQAVRDAEGRSRISAEDAGGRPDRRGGAATVRAAALRVRILKRRGAPMPRPATAAARAFVQAVPQYRFPSVPQCCAPSGRSSHRVRGRSGLATGDFIRARMRATEVCPHRVTQVGEPGHLRPSANWTSSLETGASSSETGQLRMNCVLVKSSCPVSDKSGHSCCAELRCPDLSETDSAVRLTQVRVKDHALSCSKE